MKASSMFAFMLMLFAAGGEAAPGCYFTRVEKHALYGSNTQVLKDLSLPACRQMCLYQGDRCLSFDYNYVTDSCFLSDQNKDLDPVNFGSHGRMDYFQKECGTEVPSDYVPYEEVPPTCAPNYRPCDNHNCIRESWFCDGMDDCGDNSDEQNCTESEGCRMAERPCPNGQCIRESWFCDGEDDCGDNFDEENCTMTCRPDDILCPDTGVCIQSSDMCNGVNDCGDNFDEEDCPESSESSEEEPQGCQGRAGFNCGSSGSRISNDSCIPLAWVCDGSQDCCDFSDEADCGPGHQIMESYECI